MDLLEQRDASQLRQLEGRQYWQDRKSYQNMAGMNFSQILDPNGHLNKEEFKADFRCSRQTFWKVVNLIKDDPVLERIGSLVMAWGNHRPQLLISYLFTCVTLECRAMVICSLQQETIFDVERVQSIIIATVLPKHYCHSIQNMCTGQMRMNTNKFAIASKRNMGGNTVLALLMVLYFHLKRSLKLKMPLIMKTGKADTLCHV